MPARRTLRRYLGIACAVAATALVYGIQSATASSTTTLTFVTTNTLTPGFQTVITLFERKYPNITVNASYLNSNQFNTLIPTELAAGNAPDVFTAFPGTGALPAIQLMAKTGYLSAIPQKGWVKEMPADALPDITVNKKVYAYPLGQNAYFLLYNKAQFTALHLKVPQTFAQLNALCTQIKADGKIPLTQAGSVLPNNGVAATQLASGTVYSADPNWNTQKASGKKSFVNTQGWQQAMSEFGTLATGGCFESGAAGQSVPGSTQQFASGQALMWLANSQNIGLVLAANPNFDLGVAATPAETAKQQVVEVAYPTNLVISAHSPNQTAAQEFVNFFAQPVNSGAWNHTAGYTSPVDVIARKFSPYIASLAPFYKQSRTRVNPFFAWPNPIVFGDEGTDVQGLLTGQLSATQVLTDMDNAWAQPAG